MDTLDVDGLFREAADLGRISEELRQQQLTAARRRQEAIFSLHAAGLSIREIAKRLNSSPAVVQASIRSARARRPVMIRREERIPFELHLQLGLKLHEDEVAIRRVGRAGIQRMREKPRNPVAEEWLNRWEELLERPVDELEAAMLEDSPFAKELRQMSPFNGILTQDERVLAIKKAAALAP
ncbi:helix-turn-helix domain-containing protein [Paenarthrobacter sp.]|uniref:helix-turn-helix domain-containing protein n=1 Tax=Paenarthrobacter sp. TaxID=1931993 RepID=UPI002811CB92|nr:helix-turn-helix domain-containing protein [Paenarthrobacter sp.]